MTNPRHRIFVVWLYGMVTMFALSAGLVSCREAGGTVWSRFSDVGPEGLEPQMPETFRVEPADSAAARQLKHRMVLHVRYPRRMTPPPFRLLVTADCDTGTFFTDTVTVRPGRHGEQAPGQGALGVLEITDTVIENFSLPPGWTEFSVSSLSPAADTKGLSSIGLSLEQM